MLTFEEALRKAGDKEKSILLGNGFSRACFNDIFSYDSLFESSGLNGNNSPLKKLFNVTQTKDFEKIIQILQTAAITIQAYEGSGSSLASKLSADAERLRDLLAETISGNHPNLPSDISQQSYESCRQFLSNFKKYFSLNYDLLLYWALIKNELPPRLSPDDGFGRDDHYQLSWSSDRSDVQNIFYLHGALHLFDSGDQLIKIEWGGTGGIRLKDQILSRLELNEYPLIVAEGTSSQKRRKIFHNKYFGFCHDQLKGLSDSLFIYGFAMSENDEHILESIESSYVSNLFVGIYGDPNSATNKKIIERTNLVVDNRRRYRGRSSLVPHFYDAESVNIWGK